MVKDHDQGEYEINHPGPGAARIEISAGSGQVAIAEREPEAAATREEELARVLKMVETGKLTPEEGLALLDALEQAAGGRGVRA